MMAGTVRLWCRKFISTVVILVLLLAIFGLSQVLAEMWGLPEERLDLFAPIAFSDFLIEFGDHQIRDVIVDKNRITGHLTRGQSFSTVVPPQRDLVNQLLQGGVHVGAGDDDVASPLFQSLVAWSPALILLALISVYVRALVRSSEGTQEVLRDVARRLSLPQGGMTGTVPVAVTIGQQILAPLFTMQLSLETSDHFKFNQICQVRIRNASKSSATWQGFLMVMTGFAIAAASSYAFIQMQPHLAGWTSRSVGFLGFAGYFIGYEVTRRWSMSVAKGIWRRTGAVPTMLAVGEEGVVKTSAKGYSFHPWSVVYEVTDEAGLICLWLDELQAVLFPRRAFPEPATGDALLAFARAHCRPEAPSIPAATQSTV